MTAALKNSFSDQPTKKSIIRSKQKKNYKKQDLFLKHLESFAAHKVCYNVQGGAHCRCTCLHILQDFTILIAVAKWCFKLQNSRKQNKIKLVLIGFAMQHF